MDGSLFDIAVRQAPAMAVSFSWLTWFVCMQWVLALFVPRVLYLRASAFAGQGSSSIAFRGSYAGVPFIIKLPRAPGVIAKEWTLLQRSLPADPGVASRLPIPRYYGLFRLDAEGHLMLTSYDGEPFTVMKSPPDLDWRYAPMQHRSRCH